MIKQTLFLLIAAFSILASSADSRTATIETAVTVKEITRGYTLSVHALAEPFENLLRVLCEQCRVRFICRGGRLLQPISMHFHDLPLEQAIKKLIKAAGIKNYLIRYCARGNFDHAITEVIIFGNSATAKAAFNKTGTPSEKQQHELSDDLNLPTAPDDEHTKKIASLKDRYLWEDEQTRAWAVHLLEAMPDEVKDFGLDCIMKELDKNNDPGKKAAVNAELFYRAIEAAAPPAVAPVMMQQVRKVSEQYHESKADVKADISCDRF